MGKETDAALMKSNSAGASIKFGYRLFAENFKKVFRASWVFATLFGVVCGVIGPILSIRMPFILMQMTANPSYIMAYASEYTGLAIILLLMVIIGGIVEMIFYSRGLALLKGHKANGVIERAPRWFSFDKSIAWRTIKGTLASLLVFLLSGVIMGLLYYIGWKTSLIKPDTYAGLAVWLIVCTIIVLMVYIPLCFIVMKYILNENTRFWPLFLSDYKRSLHHFGYIFIVSFFVGIVIFLATYVLQLPTVIISTANYQANLGMFYGDNLGMPDYIAPLTVFVFFVSGFMQAYIRMSAMFPFYYMYGSIETQEEEKKQYKEQLVLNN